MEPSRWNELMKNLRELAVKNVAALNKLDNSFVDPALLRQTADFLNSQLPHLTEQSSEDFYTLFEDLIRKIVL